MLFAPTLRATQRVAALLAADARRGDVLCLHGEVGAGKSALSRAYVRAVAGDPHVDVPSPTFLLQQVYDDHCDDDDAGPPPVHHFDLYRLKGPGDCDRLGLEESFATASSLIEWAERLGERCPGERLDVYIDAAAVGDGAGASEGAGVVVEMDDGEDGEEDGTTTTRRRTRKTTRTRRSWTGNRGSSDSPRGATRGDGAWTRSPRSWRGSGWKLRSGDA